MHTAQLNNLKDSAVIIKQNVGNFPSDPFPDQSSLLPAAVDVPAELIQALRQAGIAESKRSSLARLPGMTVQRVRLWEQHLVQ
jgi:DNA-binding transcriptional regulator YiaG